MIAKHRTINTIKMYAVHGVMPDMYACFAKHSRINIGESTGLCLLKRAVRHATVPLIPSFLNNQLEVGLLNNEMYFDLRGQVKASMKSALYNTRISFSKELLLACMCNCQSGSDKHN